MRFDFLVLFNLVFALVPASIMAIVARRNSAYRGEIAPAAAVTAFVATLVTLVSWQIVGANLDAPDWTRADSLGFAGIGLVLIPALAVATAAALLARRLETERTPEPVVPRAGLAPGARGVWLGTARAKWALPFVVGFIAGGLVLAIAVHPLLGLLFGLIGLLGLPFTAIRVTADRRGVRISYGALGWPIQRIPLTDIRQASAITVIPMQRGGWGYRGSLRLMGRAAVVLRGGDGIQLDLAGSRRLVITVDDAADGAGLINDLIDAPSAP